MRLKVCLLPSDKVQDLRNKLKDVGAVGVGFVDGDIELVYQRE